MWVDAFFAGRNYNKMVLPTHHGICDVCKVTKDTCMTFSFSDPLRLTICTICLSENPSIIYQEGYVKSTCCGG